MTEQNAEVCSGGPKLIFACSGAADVGAVADQAARRMTKRGAGQMFCLAGVGGRIAPIMEKTKSASKILAIDGCPLNCVSETLKQAGFDQFGHMLVTDLGLEKGSTEINDENICKAVARGTELLAD
ncbi:putative zinc-binding protein [Verrucomicrobiota bacterium]